MNERQRPASDVLRGAAIVIDKLAADLEVERMHYNVGSPPHAVHALARDELLLLYERLNAEAQAQDRERKTKAAGLGAPGI